MNNRENILEKNTQSEMSPMDVLRDLKDGNKRYMNTSFINQNISKLRNSSVSGQNPKAIILSCIDSRVVVEQVFDQVLGDVFVARVAGNFANTDIVASMEYACKVAGSKLILVLGHEACGAVKAACDNVELGNITSLLANIKPVCETTKKVLSEPHDSSNDKYVNEVIDQNVLHTINQIRNMSPILKELEDSGQIAFVGGVYKLASGEVKWL